jgi:hypothetical protein
MQRREERLQLAVTWTGRWLIAQGVLGCIMTEWLSQHISLRWQVLMVPYIRQSGIALLALGLFVNAALKQPRYQAMAVDALILSLLGQSYFILSYRLSGNEVNAFEWLSLLINLGLGSALTLWRTRSSELDPATTTPLLAKPVHVYARDLKDQALTLVDPKRRKEAALEAAARKAAQAAEAAAPAGEPAAKRSEAVPHLD